MEHATRLRVEVSIKLNVWYHLRATHSKLIIKIIKSICRNQPGNWLWYLINNCWKSTQITLIIIVYIIHISAHLNTVEYCCREAINFINFTMSDRMYRNRLFQRSVFIHSFALTDKTRTTISSHKLYCMESYMLWWRIYEMIASRRE